jgi:hypothetical protein
VNTGPEPVQCRSIVVAVAEPVQLIESPEPALGV